ncbi:MAG: hypothetical protein ACK480_17385 [Planctomycetota bacterium]
MDQPVASCDVKDGGSLESPAILRPLGDGNAVGIAGGNAGGGGDGKAAGVCGDTVGNAGAITGSGLGLSAAAGIDGGNTAEGIADGNGLTGTDRTGGWLGGGANGATSGSDGRDTAGGALTGAPPGGNKLGGASTLGRGATIRDASNFGGSPTTGTAACPEANAISGISCGGGSFAHSPILAGSGTGGRLGKTPPSEAIASESTTMGLANTAE